MHHDSRQGRSAGLHRTGRLQAASIRSPHSSRKRFIDVRQLGAARHRFATFCSARYSSFSAASSLGNEARVLITLRSVMFRDSTMLVV